MNNPQVHHHYVVHVIHFSLPIKPTIMGGIIPRLMDFNESFINKSNVSRTLWNLGGQHLLLLGHWILMAKTKLMQDAVKMMSSFFAFFQFQWKVSYLIALSCFTYKKKLIKHCFENNLNNHLKVQGGSFENLT
jgi:hypothetical protein